MTDQAVLDKYEQYQKDLRALYKEARKTREDVEASLPNRVVLRKEVRKQINKSRAVNGEQKTRELLEIAYSEIDRKRYEVIKPFMQAENDAHDAWMASIWGALQFPEVSSQLTKFLTSS